MYTDLTIYKVDANINREKSETTLDPMLTGKLAIENIHTRS